ncbi:hypothetical protein BGZ51_006686 [Haplosporangium sp. Z 767]|nr:hypothetical protein BGZ51_006686 [Haplosporangium sp. Z 767]KAF9194485.1 hypothetical protein BGZ50_006210 [Haplosporangium sp. Z 11]
MASPTAHDTTETASETISPTLNEKTVDLRDCEAQEITPTPMIFPDGGFGWLVVFGAFMIQFCPVLLYPSSGFGFNFSWGVYQEYYVKENIFPGATLSQVSWVGGIGASSVFLTGPFQTSMVSYFGLRPVIAAGIVISACGIILASFATTLWQLYLTQWFDKKRGMASGITAAGSGAGGAVLAPLNRYLISKIGYKWALRTMGLAFIAIVFSVMFCIRPRIPANKRGGPLFDFKLFKDRGFTTMYLMGVLVTFGYLTPVFLLPKYVTDLGMDPATGAMLVAVFSGVNAVSRIALGVAADRLGRFNVLFLCTAMSGLACYIFWLNTKGLAMAVVFMVFYGINGGGFVSLFPVVAAEIMGVQKMTAAVGLLYSGNLFGNLLGAPIASAIVTASGSYAWAIVFAGTTPILGAILLMVHRLQIEPRIFVKV